VSLEWRCDDEDAAAAEKIEAWRQDYMRITLTVF
jgi:hypothetical protein